MPIFDVKGTMEDITEEILDSITEEVKLIARIQNQTPESKMRMFQVYFRGLKDGLRISSGGIINYEDRVIDMIDHNIIGEIISGGLSDKEGWNTLSALVTQLAMYN
jgi:hypothetical protein